MITQQLTPLRRGHYKGHLIKPAFRIALWYFKNVRYPGTPRVEIKDIFKVDLRTIQE